MAWGRNAVLSEVKDKPRGWQGKNYWEVLGEDDGLVSGGKGNDSQQQEKRREYGGSKKGNGRVRESRIRKIGTMNVNGANAGNKIDKIMRCYKEHKLDMLLLQEMKMSKQDVESFRGRCEAEGIKCLADGDDVHKGHHERYSRGVVVMHTGDAEMVHNPFKDKAELDAGGRFLIVKMGRKKNEGREVTVCNLYLDA